MHMFWAGSGRVLGLGVSGRVKAYSVLFLVGNGGMGYGDDYWGFYKDYYTDNEP